MSSPHRLPLACAILTASLGLAGAGPTFAAGAKTRVVRAQNFAFSPSRLTIHRGESVTWRFLDAGSPHTVTSQGARRFHDSPIGRASGSFTVRFAKAGTFHYQCTIHPASMNGVITVR